MAYRVLDYVLVDEEECKILGESEDFIAFFRAGRSIYVPNVGSQYIPTRIAFGRKSPKDVNDIEILLEVSPRRS